MGGGGDKADWAAKLKGETTDNTGKGANLMVVFCSSKVGRGGSEALIHKVLIKRGRCPGEGKYILHTIAHLPETGQKVLGSLDQQSLTGVEKDP